MQAYRVGRMADFAVSRFTICIDSREQTPWTFSGMAPDAPHCDKALIVPTKRVGLKTGDYSIVGMEDAVCVERKSLSDLYSTVIHGRERFERELERMKQFDFSALVIEASWEAICNSPPRHSKANPKTIYRSLIAYAQRYGVHVYPCATPAFAERMCYRILERFWKDRQTGGYWHAKSTSGKMDCVSS